MLPKQVEETVYLAVLAGDLQIDERGRVWRVAVRRKDRWGGPARSVPCARRRAEKISGPYFQVRAMFDGKRTNALAHRLVWRHFFGPIPDGLTVNHENGVKTDNRPENLELATYAEQTRHAREVLGVGMMDQQGEANYQSKLTEADVLEIRRRRESGEPLKTIAAAFGVSDRTVSKVARRQRWAFLG